MAPRKGSEAAAELWDTCEVDAWESHISRYPDCLKAKHSDLKAEDEWRREVLSADIDGRSPKHITQEELAKLLEWKMHMGQHRASLRGYISDLTNKEVREASEAAFKVLPDIGKAVKALSTPLKGVGPATASAVLGVIHPAAPFMADECLDTTQGCRKYTPAAYVRLAKDLNEKAEALNCSQAKRRTWTASLCGEALWAAAMARRFNIGKLEDDGLIEAEVSGTSRPQKRQRNK
ncbi:unnamed protein product [Chrysoparadoxa australica]